MPQQDNFHIHEGGCSWDIDLRGSESSSEVAVAITNEVKPLPLFDVGARALGITNDAGNFEIHVEVTTPTKNVWVVSNDKGLDPKAWVGQWA